RREPPSPSWHRARRGPAEPPSARSGARAPARTWRGRARGWRGTSQDPVAPWQRAGRAARPRARPMRAGSVPATGTRESPTRPPRQRKGDGRASTASAWSPLRRGHGTRRLRGLPAPDLGDLAIAVAGQPLLVAPQVVVQALDLLGGGGPGQSRLVQDVQLRDLRRVELAGLGDGGLLLLGQGPVLD